MKYLVTEIQTMADGQVANLTSVFDDRMQAESSYHSILAAAAISQLPLHACMMYTNDGYLVMSANYVHEQPSPEPGPEPEPEPNQE